MPHRQLYCQHCNSHLPLKQYTHCQSCGEDLRKPAKVHEAKQPTMQDRELYNHWLITQQKDGAHNQ